MTYREAPKAATKEPKVFGGFTRDGQWFASQTPVHGALTDFVRRMVKLTGDGASPCDTILHLSNESHEVRAVFVGVSAQWAGLTRGEDWPTAYTSCSAHEAIKRAWRGAA